jgi:hypothetical protein
MTAPSARYHGPLMTLGNMRQQSVRSLWVVCELCHHEAVLYDTATAMRPGCVTRAKSRLHYTLLITALIVWNKTRAPTIWTLTFIVGVFVNNAFSFAFWTGFHS